MIVPWQSKLVWEFHPSLKWCWLLLSLTTTHCQNFNFQSEEEILLWFEELEVRELLKKPPVIYFYTAEKLSSRSFIFRTAIKPSTYDQNNSTNIELLKLNSLNFSCMSCSSWVCHDTLQSQNQLPSDCPAHLPRNNRTREIPWPFSTSNYELPSFIRATAVTGLKHDLPHRFELETIKPYSCTTSSFRV